MAGLPAIHVYAVARPPSGVATLATSLASGGGKDYDGGFFSASSHFFAAVSPAVRASALTLLM
jgi:hypothetical protein